MALSDIRTKVKITTDKTRLFSTSDIDDAINDYQIDAWLELDKIAPHLTRKTEDLALVASTASYTLAATDFLKPIFIKPPAASIHGKTFIFSSEDQAFYQHTDDANPLVAQRGAQTFIISPTPSGAMTVTFHFTYKPPTITTSQAPTIFDTDTLAPGAIAKLFADINFPDVALWEARAARRLRKFLSQYQYRSDPGTLTMRAAGAFFNR